MLAFRAHRAWPVAMLMFALLGAPSGLTAQEDQGDTPMALQSIMEQMGVDLLSLTERMLHQDWPAVAKLAAALANHEEPPLQEKQRILAWLGKEASTFREFDIQVKAEAKQLEAGAHEQDTQAMLASLSQLQQSCVGCHASFRQPYLAHFYR